jgi:hypothetical protein
MSLQKSSETLLVHENGESALSIYQGELKQETVAKNVAKIKAAFPALPKDFFTLLIDRAKDKGFSDARLTDAVNNVIDTCQYPTPTLANFLSFDKRVKVFNYSEMCNAITNSGFSSSSFAQLRINGKLFWVKQSDKEVFNLPDEI